jgi:hypothetical protein
MRITDCNIARFTYYPESTLTLFFPLRQTGANHTPFDMQCKFFEERLTGFVNKTLSKEHSIKFNTMQGWPPHFLIQKTNHQSFNESELKSLVALFKKKLSLD